eukprot:CAMPEP_0203808948 /NCGR_PEP_ID=MMETSP0115-20131106/1931_1 /ASSEMBLY_ACC=CAM_ASM_000227 /TAXON_ID=33651 /ORGANISM="Bicosoecid sp, Strain ms1" /LENGTH=71 /DNA_ID=CAMNT_0050717655 /DNA_START=47 /DNA_END=259 /DNA_ORIENTATION=-
MALQLARATQPCSAACRIRGGCRGSGLWRPRPAARVPLAAPKSSHGATPDRTLTTTTQAARYHVDRPSRLP